MTTRAELLDHLDTLAQAGHLAPCVTSPDIDFTSEKPAIQRLAAALCSTCPGVDPCRSYGLSHPREIGVLGGLADNARQTRTTPTTETDI